MADARCDESTRMRLVNIAAVGALAAGALLLSAATAVADPPPEIPIDPTVSPPPSYLDAARSGPLAQSNDAAPGVAGLPDLSGIQNQMLLGQASNPALPGADPGTPVNPNPLNNSYLLPQNVEPSAPGEGQIFGVDAGQEDADIKRRDYLRRLWGMYQAGGLDGALLGQRPESELNQPVPAPAG